MPALCACPIQVPNNTSFPKTLFFHFVIRFGKSSDETWFLYVALKMASFRESETKSFRNSFRNFNTGKNFIYWNQALLKCYGPVSRPIVKFIS